jgi:hypothetical protein
MQGRSSPILIAVAIVKGSTSFVALTITLVMQNINEDNMAKNIPSRGPQHTLILKTRKLVAS